MDSGSSSGSYGIPRYAQGTSGDICFDENSLKRPGLETVSNEDLIAELQRRIKR